MGVCISCCVHSLPPAAVWLPPQEVGDLRKTLNNEVDSLRAEFMDLKGALKQQLELTAGLASQVGYA